MSSSDVVAYHVENRIAWLKFNRPDKRNAMSPTLNREMDKVLDGLETDDRCGVVVITGAGDSFSAGMDLKEYFRETDHAPPVVAARVRREAMAWQWRRLRFFPKPTIAMVNGWCFGGALTPVASCDLAIAAEEAVFGISEINWGIIPAGNVTRAVAEKMTQSDALYYLMTGETFTGKQAAAMRFVNEAVPRKRLRERTEALAKLLLSKNPHVLRAVKHAYHRVKDMNWDDSEEYLYAKAQETYSTDPEQGRRAGMSQFLDDKTYRPGLANYRRR
jgi:trans-feruloyl-CoA hydratase/vanillin synthase